VWQVSIVHLQRKAEKAVWTEKEVVMREAQDRGERLQAL
jgi:hypothetical protein